MSADRDALRALEGKALVRPWHRWVLEGYGLSEADAALIAAMRNALPALLDAADERDRLVAGIEALVRGLHEDAADVLEAAMDGRGEPEDGGYVEGLQSAIRRIGALLPKREQEAGR